MLHDGRAGCSGRVALHGLAGANLLLLSLLLLGLPQKAHSQIFGAWANQLELTVHKLDLFDQLVGGGTLPELYGLNESVLELTAQDVRSLNFKNVVTKCDEVSHRLLVHILACL